MESGRQLVSTSFVIPYPPGHPILVPGQVLSPEILAFMRQLDITEIHGYRPELGLQFFTEEALAGVAADRGIEPEAGRRRQAVRDRSSDEPRARPPGQVQEGAMGSA